MSAQDWSAELASATRDARNLSYLLGEMGGGDGTPHTDPLVYGALCRALDHAHGRAVRAAEQIAGLAPKVPRKLSLEERRTRVAEVFAAGMRCALVERDLSLTSDQVNERASAFAAGRVKGPAQP